MSFINKNNIMAENPSNSPNFIQTVIRTLQYVMSTNKNYIMILAYLFQ